MVRILDSCGWIYYLGGAPLATVYGAYIDGTEPIIMPAVVLFEVHCWSRAQVAEDLADIYLGAIQRRTLTASLDPAIAALAAELRTQHHIPAVDSLIYAHAVQLRCTLVTSDQHLQHLPGVEYHATPGTSSMTPKARRAARRP